MPQHGWEELDLSAGLRQMFGLEPHWPGLGPRAAPGVPGLVAGQNHGSVRLGAGPPATLSVVMMCEARSSCQIWWMQDEAAVEVTFNRRLLPDWAAIRHDVSALLRRLRAP